MKTSEKEIYEAAYKIRKLLEENCCNTPDAVFQDFPRYACGATSELLARLRTH